MFRALEVAKSNSSVYEPSGVLVSVEVESFTQAAITISSACVVAAVAPVDQPSAEPVADVVLSFADEVAMPLICTAAIIRAVSLLGLYVQVIVSDVVRAFVIWDEPIATSEDEALLEMSVAQVLLLLSENVAASDAELAPPTQTTTNWPAATDAEAVIAIVAEAVAAFADPIDVGVPIAI